MFHHSTCFGRKRPSSGVFKTSTAATGTCVIFAGKSSHLLIRAGTECTHSTCFGRNRPSSGLFKTSTAATGTCVIVVGQSSHLLIIGLGGNFKMSFNCSYVTFHSLLILHLHYYTYTTHPQFIPLKHNDHYSVRTAPLTSKVAFYIFIQQI